jgi:hypothetical protein
MIDWKVETARYQYPEGYQGRCMYCVECGEENHTAHALWAERDLEATLFAAQERQAALGPLA